MTTSSQPAPVEILQGDSPVILGLPHTGTHIPEAILNRLNTRGRQITDTDWHIEKLYAGLLPGATTVRATFHRYVVDANRSPDNESLYPGQNTTGLVADTDFDGHPIWDHPPSPEDLAERVAAFHAPYHAALAAEIARLRRIHPVVVLYDCHSIRSRIPFLFEGVLPDFNIGTHSGASCDPRIAEATREICAASGRTWALNGRFKGGWTTRHYGRPETGVHVIQMELAQSTHLASETLPFDYDPARAASLRATLAEILHRLEAIAREMGQDLGRGLGREMGRGLGQ